MKTCVNEVVIYAIHLQPGEQNNGNIKIINMWRYDINDKHVGGDIM